MTGITIEHSEIIGWTNTRGGRPAIGDLASEFTRPAIQFSEEGRSVPWEEWLSIFDQGEWAFVYQDRTPEGELSRVCKIIPRFAA